MIIKDTNIVYFTGTGGTKRVAEFMKTAFEKRNINVKLTQANVAPFQYNKSELLVVLFPVYISNEPVPIAQWLKNLPNGENCFCSVIAVSGAGEVKQNIASRMGVTKKLEKKKYNVVYEDMVVLPPNCIYTYDLDLCALLLKKAPVKAEKMVTNILADKIQRIEPDFSSRFIRVISLVGKPLARINGKHYSVNDNCISCSKCENTCPRENIKMRNGKPEFGNSCAMCLNCVYVCPQKAIMPAMLKTMVLPDGYSIAMYEQRANELTQQEIDVVMQKDNIKDGIKLYLQDL